MLNHDELNFDSHALDEEHLLYAGKLPEDLQFDASAFDSLWALHPEEYHEIMMHGRQVKTPRWQQAYGKDYHYTGQVNKALAIPQVVQPLLTWCQTSFDSRLNGILFNWYDG